MDTPQPTTPAPAPGSPSPHARRSAQVALATFLAVLLGLLAFRGYGSRLGARPTEHVPAAARQVDLNRADRVELEQVDGIGPKLARAIDDHRRERGPFRSVRVRPGDGEPGPPVRAGRGRPGGRAGTAAARTQAHHSRLASSRNHVPQAETGRPADRRERRVGGRPPAAAGGRPARPFKAVDDLDRVKGIGPKTLEKVRPFVVVK
jgi:competence protein ComEA